MVGSVADAGDLLQEAFLRWQQASAEEIRSPKGLLAYLNGRLFCVLTSVARRMVPGNAMCRRLQFGQ